MPTIKLYEMNKDKEETCFFCLKPINAWHYLEFAVSNKEEWEDQESTIAHYAFQVCDGCYDAIKMIAKYFAENL